MGKKIWGNKGKIILIFVGLFVIFIVGKYSPPQKASVTVPYEEKILNQFEKAGIWKVDKENHRCLVDPGVWMRLPLEQKENALRIIYREENTWWKIYDMNSGKILGEVSSWGVKIHP